MALATQCPYCKTTFRVAQDQLKLRGGLVRCGACKEIFNGTEHLLAADAIGRPVSAAGNAVQAEALPMRQEDLMQEAAAPAPVLASEALDFAYPEPLPEDDSERFAAPSDESYMPDSEQIEPGPAMSPDASDHLNRIIEELARKPGEEPQSPAPEISQSIPQAEEQEEPNFVKQGRRKQKRGRTLHIAMLVASFILLLTALGQATYTVRDQIAARVPAAKPLLLTFCSFMHCSIGLPAQIEAVTIESDELEQLASNKEESLLTMLLRNASTTPQAWPHIELTLSDANGTMLARRVFAPAEYLAPDQEAARGLASDSEQVIKLYFKFSQANPAGYHVRVFYP